MLYLLGTNSCIMKYAFLCLYLLLASNPTTQEIAQIIEDDKEYLVKFYKDLHMNPEISLQEEKTAAKLTSELENLGFKVHENFGGHGVVGVYKNGNGPTILYRTDMDALPMYEKTDLAYQSKASCEYNNEKVGAMHSCGHDMHMTTWVGIARAMVKMKKSWKGTLMFIGQPAEEIGQGAKNDD